MMLTFSRLVIIIRTCPAWLRDQYLS
jgi:hypothetical protein